MNIRDDIKQLKTGDRDLRKFGLVVGGVFVALGVYFLLRHKSYWLYLAWPGGVLAILGLICPRVLKYVYVGWMSIAFVLGFVVSHVILAVFFFLVITPVGWAARAVGKDFLSLKLDRAAQSYWIPRARKATTAADYERQF